MRSSLRLLRLPPTGSHRVFRFSSTETTLSAKFDAAISGKTPLVAIKAAQDALSQGSKLHMENFQSLMTLAVEQQSKEATWAKILKLAEGNTEAELSVIEKSIEVFGHFPFGGMFLLLLKRFADTKQPEPLRRFMRLADPSFVEFKTGGAVIYADCLFRCNADIDLFNRFWDLITTKNVEKSPKLVQIALHYCSKKNDFDATWRVWTECKSLGIKFSTAEVFEGVFGVCFRNNKMGFAKSVFDEMRSIGLVPSPALWTAVMRDTIKSAAESGGSGGSGSGKTIFDISPALELKSQMEKAGAVPDAKIYHTLMSALVGQRKFADMWSMLQEMKTRGVQPDAPILSLVLNALAMQGEADEAFALLKEFREKGVDVSTVAYNSVIHQFANLGDIHSCSNVTNLMIESGKTPDLISYTAQIGACRSSPLQPQQTLRAAETILDRIYSSGLQPNGYTYTEMLGACQAARNMERAWEVYQEKVQKGFKPGPWDFSHLLQCAAESGHEEDIAQITQEMNKWGIDPNRLSLNCRIAYLSNRSMWSKVVTELSIALDDGLADGTSCMLALNILANQVSHNTTGNGLTKSQPEIDLASDCDESKLANWLLSNIQCVQPVHKDQTSVLVGLSNFLPTLSPEQLCAVLSTLSEMQGFSFDRMLFEYYLSEKNRMFDPEVLSLFQKSSRRFSSENPGPFSSSLPSASHESENSAATKPTFLFDHSSFFFSWHRPEEGKQGEDGSDGPVAFMRSRESESAFSQTMVTVRGCINRLGGSVVVPSCLQRRLNQNAQSADTFRRKRAKMVLRNFMDLYANSPNFEFFSFSKDVLISEGLEPGSGKFNQNFVRVALGLAKQGHNVVVVSREPELISLAVRAGLLTKSPEQVAHDIATQ